MLPVLALNYTCRPVGIDMGTFTASHKWTALEILSKPTFEKRTRT